MTMTRFESRRNSSSSSLSTGSDFRRDANTFAKGYEKSKLLVKSASTSSESSNSSSIYRR